jgi:acyl-CoA synthetase (AMP-forming)/AMP-acid ligase II
VTLPQGWSAPPPDGYRSFTLTSGLRSAATRDPQKIALILGQERRSYAQVIENINRTANLLRGLGLGFGDHAMIVSPNSMEYLEIVAAVSDLGGAIATPNPRLTAEDLTEICNDAQAKVLFVHPDCDAAVHPDRLETVQNIIRIDADYDALKARAASDFAPPSIPDWTPFIIPYTSGTTGKPKGVLCSHRSRTQQFMAYASEYGIYSPDDYFLSLSPMCHGAGFAFAFNAIFLGGTTEIMTKFDAEAVLRRIHSGEVTGLFTVPTHYHSIFGLEEKLLASLRGNRLSGIVANAAPLSDEAKLQILDYFGEDLLHETYGSTEAGCVTNLRPKDQRRKSRCVGLPFVGNQVSLRTDEGRETVAGEVGELFSRSPYLFNGYWNKPEQTADALKDGWVGVGDLAMRDEEGFFHIVDRKKDMVISGGLNIYPREVEAVIDRHPGVRESAVIGVPHPRWGEQLVAYVVAGSDAPPADLAEFCKANLAPYKLPKVYHALAQLPRNANGKVLKTALRDLHVQAKVP